MAKAKKTAIKPASNPGRSIKGSSATAAAIAATKPKPAKKGKPK
jgi:hypothetical protein